MTTADPADLPDLTDCGKTPIAPDAPAGSDVSYDPDYEALQREIDKLSLATAARASLDWNLAARLAANILVKKSKDIKVAAYLAEALTRTGQIAGLATGVHILRDLVETYWEALFPPKKTPARPPQRPRLVAGTGQGRRGGLCRRAPAGREHRGPQGRPDRPGHGAGRPDRRGHAAASADRGRRQPAGPGRRTRSGQFSGPGRRGTGRTGRATGPSGTIGLAGPIEPTGPGRRFGRKGSGAVHRRPGRPVRGLCRLVATGPRLAAGLSSGPAGRLAALDRAPAGKRTARPCCRPLRRSFGPSWTRG